MKTSLKERFCRRLLKTGRKNRFLAFCIIPVLVAGMFFFHAVEYLLGNGKRFMVLTTTFFLFVVYSSFSFPLFLTEAGEIDAWNPIAEEAKDVALAEEVEVNLEDLQPLDDADVLGEGEEVPDMVHGMNVGERYNASDILESNQDRLPAEDHAYAGTEEDYADYEFAADDWRLILINKQNSIPDGYEGQVPLGKINTMKGDMRCDERIIDDLLAMIKAAGEDGVNLQICSPYRDLGRQEYLFNRKVTSYMNQGLSYLEAYQVASQAVTVPNASEHQIGLALDIVTAAYSSLTEGFADTEAGRWLAENSCRYGFILRYPKGKEDVTGIQFEPWHFRYVGIEAATLITKQGITLEEFWEEYL